MKQKKCRNLSLTGNPCEKFVNPRNAASKRLAERMGCRLEGCARYVWVLADALAREGEEGRGWDAKGFFPSKEDEIREQEAKAEQERIQMFRGAGGMMYHVR